MSNAGGEERVTNILAMRVAHCHGWWRWAANLPLYRTEILERGVVVFGETLQC